MVYKKSTALNITSNMSSFENNIKLDGEILYLRSRSQKLLFMIFLNFIFSHVLDQYQDG